MEFMPRGESVWISSRDDNRVSIIDTQTLATRARLEVPSPSGIFFTRALPAWALSHAWRRGGLAPFTPSAIEGRCSMPGNTAFRWCKSPLPRWRKI